MKWPSGREGAWRAPVPKLLLTSPQDKSARAITQVEERALLCLILRKLAEIQATLASPLVKRQLWPRFCVGCGTLVTNKNCGGYTGRSALTGALYCENCCDEIEGAQ